MGGAALAWQQKNELPPPFATPSSRNNPKVIKRPEGAQLKLARGFVAEEYLTDFKVPRFMLLCSHGEMLVSRPEFSLRGVSLSKTAAEADAAS